MKFTLVDKEVGLVAFFGGKMVSVVIILEKRVIGSRSFDIKEFKGGCHNPKCERKVFKGPHFSVINYLPKEKKVVLKFAATCECKVTNELCTLVDMDIEAMIGVTQ